MDITIFLFTQTLGPKQILFLFVHMENSNGNVLVTVLLCAHTLSIFLDAMFKLLFKFLDDFLIFYVDGMMVYSKMESEHLVYKRKVLKNLGMQE